jgi:hypothetical protein
MTVIRPAQITELNRLLEIVSAATHHMESQGIHQWDNIYPDGTTLKADIEKQRRFRVCGGISH